MNDQNSTVYRFGRFHLNPSRHALYLDGSEVPLAPRSFEVLIYLIRNPGRLISKEELLKAVWPDSFVEEANLAQHIFRLRRALESGQNRGNLILTLPGRGYQFTAEVQQEFLQADAAHDTSSLPDMASPGEPDSSEVAAAHEQERTQGLSEEASPNVLVTTPHGFKKAAILWGAVFLILSSLAGWAFWQWHEPGVPHEYRQVVLAEFLNTTGNITFDHTLRRALEVDLAQSPYMDVLSEREEVNTLKSMGRTSDTLLTSDVATEICERTNREVLLSGTISSLGNRYLLTLTGSNCSTGKLLAAVKAEVNRREDILDALDSVALRIREQLKESSQSLENHGIPLRTATTSSLEALRAFSVGKYLQSQHKGLSERIAAYQKAIELDPQFAMAYRELAVEYENIGQNDLARQNNQKAFDLSGHLSPIEQHLIRAAYYGYGQNNLLEGIKEYQILESLYPREGIAPINIMDEATRLGLYDLSISTGERALRRFPREGTIYANLSEAYKCANRFDDAEAAARTSQRLTTGDIGADLALFRVAFARQDQAALARENQLFDGQVYVADTSFWYAPGFRGEAATALGKYSEAERLFQSSYKAAQMANLPETANRILINQALAEQRLGFRDVARTTLHRVNPSNVKPAELAIAWAELGDTALAERSLAAFKGPSPDTLLTYEMVPQMQALVALQHHKPLEAVESLKLSAPYEMRSYAVPELRGRSCLEAGQPDLAIAEFKKIIDNPGIDSTSALYPLAHLGMARAYAMKKMNVESRREYEAFFLRWKDADDGLPILKQARAEYAMLGTDPYRSPQLGT